MEAIQPGEPSWPSPGGIETQGRPGWHIECSAMAAAHLGDVFDIHGGGIDLVFPHHENEIAQSRCAHGSDVMANVWMHNGFLQVEGEKMSKSLGNFVTVHELLDTMDFGGTTWPGEAIRFNMLKTHYRQPLDWTFVSLDEAHKTLWEWYGVLEGRTAAPDVPASILDALSDDLNTPKVIAELHKLHRAGHFEELRTALGFLGFSGERANIRRGVIMHVEPATIAIEGQPATLVLGGVFDPDADSEKVSLTPEAWRLMAERHAARQEKNFGEADRIRDELSAMGIVLKDKKDPVTGRIVTEWEMAR